MNKKIDNILDNKWWQEVAVVLFSFTIYTLKNDLNSEINEQYDAFDIADWNRVVFDGFVVTNEDTNSSYFSPGRLYGSEYENVVVSIQKNGAIYTIDYTMIYGGKTIKGFFEGELQVVDEWQ